MEREREKELGIIIKEGEKGIDLQKSFLSAKYPDKVNEHDVYLFEKLDEKGWQQ